MHRLIRFSLLAGCLVPALAVAEPVSHPSTIEHHQLTLELLPDSHQLIATDRLTLSGGDSGQALAFSLAPALQLERIQDVTHCQDPCESAPEVAFRRDGSAGQSEPQRVILKPPVTKQSDGSVRLKFSYRGVIDDPPRDPRHLRFVTPSETSGHIGPEGVYLSSESQWYPDLDDSLATYDVTIRVPEGWAAVTQGIAQRLLTAAEDAARSAGKTVLVLDTVTGGDAERLYQRAGWQRVGEIPNYARMPDGALCSTTYFHKQL